MLSVEFRISQFGSLHFLFLLQSFFPINFSLREATLRCALCTVNSLSAVTAATTSFASPAHAPVNRSSALDCLRLNCRPRFCREMLHSTLSPRASEFPRATLYALRNPSVPLAGQSSARTPLACASNHRPHVCRFAPPSSAHSAPRPHGATSSSVDCRTQLRCEICDRDLLYAILSPHASEFPRATRHASRVATFLRATLRRSRAATSRALRAALARLHGAKSATVLCCTQLSRHTPAHFHAPLAPLQSLRGPDAIRRRRIPGQR